MRNLNLDDVLLRIAMRLYGYGYGPWTRFIQSGRPRAAGHVFKK